MINLSKQNFEAELIVTEKRIAELEAERDAALDEVKRLKQTVIHLGEYWNCNNNERAMQDACEYVQDECAVCLERIPAAVAAMLAAREKESASCQT